MLLALAGLLGAAWDDCEAFAFLPRPIGAPSLVEASASIIMERRKSVCICERYRQCVLLGSLLYV